MKKLLQIALLSVVVVALCQARHIGPWPEYDVLTTGAPASSQQSSVGTTWKKSSGPTADSWYPGGSTF